MSASQAFQWASWVAPAATMVAAIMTAANLGARITGWGFVVFTIGSLGWIMVAIGSGQSNLLWTNMLLTLVNIVGIIRWLGRTARLEDGAAHAEETSGAGRAPQLISIGLLADCEIMGRDGPVAHGVGAMIDSATGKLSYLVAREGGIGGVGEHFHALAWDTISIVDGRVTTDFSGEEIRVLPAIDPRHWPVSDAAIAGGAGLSPD